MKEIFTNQVFNSPEHLKEVSHTNTEAENLSKLTAFPDIDARSLSLVGLL